MTRSVCPGCPSPFSKEHGALNQQDVLQSSDRRRGMSAESLPPWPVW